VSDEGAAAPRAAAPMPWEGRPERADLFLMAAIIGSGLYYLALWPLTPLLIDSHPVVLELVKGSWTAMITMGAKARIGEASWVIAVLAGIPGLMWLDWIFWWAGRRWGRRAIAVFVGNHPKADARIARFERFVHRFDWLAIVLVYFTPIPNPLVYASAGWARMRLATFLVLDLIGTLLWIGFCVGLGYAIGQEAVDVAKAVGRYGLYLTIVMVVVIVARQVQVARRQAQAERQTS
jgi:membrane protein DedA with SNARE-associated domain